MMKATFDGSVQLWSGLKQNRDQDVPLTFMLTDIANPTIRLKWLVTQKGLQAGS